jgi:hypothetical protein
MTADHKPGPQDALSPHHFVIVRVHSDGITRRVVGLDGGESIAPYGTPDIELQDR